MPNYVTIGATALFAGILCAAPVSPRISPEGNLSLSIDNATAEIGRPLTATSVAGVHRRHVRRAYRRGNYQYGAYNRPYRYGYATVRPYGDYGYGSYRPWFGSSWSGSWNPTWSGYASRPYTGYRYDQQPYGGYGYRHWTQF